MNAVTDDMWEAYYLTQPGYSIRPDHRGLSYEKAAKKMGVTFEEVEQLLGRMKHDYPDLFTDISGDGYRPGHNTEQYSPLMDRSVKRKF